MFDSKGVYINSIKLVVQGMPAGDPEASLSTLKQLHNRWPIPLVGEINTPQSMDAAGECSAYYKLTAVFQAWTKRVSEF
jgi:hypothetical protein